MADERYETPRMVVVMPGPTNRTKIESTLVGRSMAFAQVGNSLERVFQELAGEHLR